MEVLAGVIALAFQLAFETARIVCEAVSWFIWAMRQDDGWERVQTLRASTAVQTLVAQGIPEPDAQAAVVEVMRRRAASDALVALGLTKADANAIARGSFPKRKAIPPARPG